jgi:hypothetical protein
MKKLIVRDIFCALAKALGCVHHDVLLSKLNFCRKTGKVYEWIKSYLRNMYQRVAIKIKKIKKRKSPEMSV